MHLGCVFNGARELGNNSVKFKITGSGRLGQVTPAEISDFFKFVVLEEQPVQGGFNHGNEQNHGFPSAAELQPKRFTTDWHG